MIKLKVRTKVLAGGLALMLPALVSSPVTAAWADGTGDSSGSSNSAISVQTYDPDVLAGWDNEGQPPPGVLVEQILAAVITPSAPLTTVSGVSLDRFDDSSASQPGNQVVLADYRSGPSTATGYLCTPSVNTTTFQGYGCVTVWRLTGESDGNHNYFVHDFQAAGNPTGGGDLWRLKWRDMSKTANNNTYVYQQLQHSPSSDEPFGSCGTASAGIGAYGASFGYSWQVCSAKIHPWANADLFHSSWISNSSSGIKSGTVATEGDSEWAGSNSDTKGLAIDDAMWWYQ